MVVPNFVSSRVPDTPAHKFSVAAVTAVMEEENIKQYCTCFNIVEEYAVGICRVVVILFVLIPIPVFR